MVSIESINLPQKYHFPALIRQMKESELILNQDGSIYHLALRPEELASTVITVGDPERVNEVSQHFDNIEVKKSKREFVTHTGYIGSKRITCLSTGMGSDNIDIVINELDALVNIDFDSHIHKSDPTSLTIVRIGTSGSISEDVHVDDILCSRIAIGLEGLMLWYEQMQMTMEENEWSIALSELHLPIRPFVCQAEPILFNLFRPHFKSGITLTTAGFYAPQSRNLRLNSQFVNILTEISSLKIRNESITNIEMETAAIYGLSKALGHKAISVNAILADRVKGTFSTNPEKVIGKSIYKSLDLLCG
jgi:uridine phosphorylase